MAVYVVISLLEISYVHHMYVPLWPTQIICGMNVKECEGYGV